MNKIPKILLKSRKAQVGRTLTWIFAFILIFFIMLLFTSATAFLSGKKFLSREWNIISLDEGQDVESLDSQKILMRILNTPVDEEKTIKDLIFEWQLSKDESVKEKIEEEVRSILESDEDISYYFFMVTSDLDKPTKDYIWIGKGDLDSPKEVFELNLFLNGQKINVGLLVDKKEVKRDVERRTQDIIIIHYTAGYTSEDAIRAMRNDKLSVHYMIDRNGFVISKENEGEIVSRKLFERKAFVKEDKVAQHAGCYDTREKEQRTPCKGEKPKPGEKCCIDVNAMSIGIELVNLGDVCESAGNVCENKIERNGIILEEFSEEQMESLTSLVANIASRYNIPIDRDHIVGHDEVAPGYKSDPGPAFNWTRFIEDLKLKEEI